MTWDEISCPIRLPHDKGEYAKRCPFHTGIDGICPQHGNVSALLKKYKKTGLLIDESDAEKVRKEVEPPSILTRIKRLVHQLTKE